MARLDASVERGTRVRFGAREQQVFSVGCRPFAVGTGDPVRDVDDEFAAVVHRELCAVMEARLELGPDDRLEPFGRVGRVHGTFHGEALQRVVGRTGKCHTIP